MFRGTPPPRLPQLPQRPSRCRRCRPILRARTTELQQAGTGMHVGIRACGRPAMSLPRSVQGVDECSGTAPRARSRLGAAKGGGDPPGATKTSLLSPRSAAALLVRVPMA